MHFDSFPDEDCEIDELYDHAPAPVTIEDSGSHLNLYHEDLAFVTNLWISVWNHHSAGLLTSTHVPVYVKFRRLAPRIMSPVLKCELEARSQITQRDQWIIITNVAMFMLLRHIENTSREMQSLDEVGEAQETEYQNDIIDGEGAGEPARDRFVRLVKEAVGVFEVEHNTPSEDSSQSDASAHSAEYSMDPSASFGADDSDHGSAIEHEPFEEYTGIIDDDDVKVFVRNLWRRAWTCYDIYAWRELRSIYCNALVREEMPLHLREKLDLDDEEESWERWGSIAHIASLMLEAHEESRTLVALSEILVQRGWHDGWEIQEEKLEEKAFRWVKGALNTGR